MADEPEVVGLLSLLLLTESRRRARFAPDGSLVLLRDQDRRRWDPAMIDEGRALVRATLRRTAGPYQLQAAINAVHADADSVEDTDWPQIVSLYNRLLAVASTPVIALNRAIAVGEAPGVWNLAAGNQVDDSSFVAIRVTEPFVVVQSNDVFVADPHAANPAGL